MLRLQNRLMTPMTAMRARVARLPAVCVRAPARPLATVVSPSARRLVATAATRVATARQANKWMQNGIVAVTTTAGLAVSNFLGSAPVHAQAAQPSGLAVDVAALEAKLLNQEDEAAGDMIAVRAAARQLRPLPAMCTHTRALC